MFDKMRNNKRQITSEQTEDILLHGEYCILATLCDNGYPYATPLSYVYMDGNIYFHCAQDGQKIRNIDYCHKVCLTIVTDTHIQPDKFSTKYKSAVVFGTASDVDGDEKKKSLLELVEKYSPDFSGQGKAYIDKAFDKTRVIKVTIDHMTGKANV